MGIKINAYITADPVFSMNPAEREIAVQQLINEGVEEGQRFFIIAVRNFKNNDRELEEKTAQFAKYVYEKHGYIPVFLPMQICYDLEIAKRISGLLDIPNVVLEKNFSSPVMLGIVGEAEFVLGMRLHTLIYALRMAVPVMALDYDPKVTAVMSDSNQKYILKAEDVDVEKMCIFADEIVERRTTIREGLEELAQKNKALAEKNADVAVKIIRE